MLEEKLKKKIINAENRLEMIALIRQSAIHDSHGSLFYGRFHFALESTRVACNSVIRYVKKWIYMYIHIYGKYEGTCTVNIS